MSQDVKAAFEAFRQQCIWFRTCWDTFQHLYGSGDGVRTILGKSAIHFFVDLQFILQEYTWLQAAKLADPARTKGRENLTIAYLHEAMAAAGIAVSAEAKRHADAIYRYLDLLKPTRNRYLAHLDKDTVLNGQELGGHTEQQMYAFVVSLQAYCDEIGRSVGAGPQVLSPNGAPGDVVTLIKILENVVYPPPP
jgi:AbiU2